MLKWFLVIASLIFSSTFAQHSLPPKEQWLTLKGEPPLVIARGGLSGVFPESSPFANQMALVAGLRNTALYCNLQLTKDGVGICLTDLRLQNSTNIEDVFPRQHKSYIVNGKKIKGWFSVDYLSKDLFNRVYMIQSSLSRPSLYDGTLPIAGVEDVIGIKPSQFWLNAEHEAFYAEHDLSVSSYLQKALRTTRINFVSSSEIGILKGISGSVNIARTKLIFRFLEANEIEPTTKKTYGALAQELPMIKTFASGILVRKEYIWPIGQDKYVQPATTLVMDAHKLGLEVYASGFANDAIVGYNYSYDPIREYLQYFDNGHFAVDGVLSDFSPAASQAIACYSSFRNNGKIQPGLEQALVISSNGASGDFPGSTDLAYQRAIDDGADIIDCSVQLSKDGVPFCMEMADLLTGTTVVTAFSARTTTIPEVQAEAGIFSFDLTWAEILTLKPQISNPFMASSGLARNPAFKNKGKFMTLNEFLEFAKAKAVSGIMINVQNAAYLASKKGLDMVGTVSSALTNATFDKQSTQQVFIRSDDTSVLSFFKTKFPSYIRVLTVDSKIGDAPEDALEEIKRFAQVVAIPRGSIIEITNYFTTGLTKVVAEIKASNLSVFVYVMRNEYVSLAFDYYSEASMEISTFVDYFHVDGIITEFPNTAKRYITCPCRPTQPNPNGAPYIIVPPEIGLLMSMVAPEAKPPTDPPLPPLDAEDIVDPPLPGVIKMSSTDPSDAADGPAAKSSAAVSNVANLFVSLLSVVVLNFFISHSTL
ncbi:glycerophosphodiester phosphodiesterase GDPDL6-like [Benincasa hispida]|uniref:glycerophosphodiester phosphodiesterase GDPDL6-like n=1 Tax=Benincasa hispida TaxID=102211 RepID=UPI0019018A41|nr:glycerophosphodiester phosphodiesterase GDPDL6-like [Benincasa hispida]